MGQTWDLPVILPNNLSVYWVAGAFSITGDMVVSNNSHLSQGHSVMEELDINQITAHKI